MRLVKHRRDSKIIKIQFNKTISVLLIFIIIFSLFCLNITNFAVAKRPINKEPENADPPRNEGNSKPIVILNGPYSGTVDEKIFFDASESYDPEGDKLEFEWFLGNGEKRYSQNFYFSYNKAGKYDITVFAIDEQGYRGFEFSTATIENTVQNQAPIAVALGPYNALVNEIITFDASQSYDDEKIVEYVWSFGDGNTKRVEDPMTGYKYSTAGTYDVKLKVIDDTGLSNSDFTTATIEPDELENSYKINVEEKNNGIVLLNPQKSTYLKGESVTITAIPDSEFEFDKWTVSPPKIDIDKLSNPMSINMPSFDLTIIPHFKHILPNQIHEKSSQMNDKKDNSINKKDKPISVSDDEEPKEGSEVMSNNFDKNNKFSHIKKGVTNTINLDKTDDSGIIQVQFKLKNDAKDVSFEADKISYQQFNQKNIQKPNGKIIRYLDISLYSEKGTFKERYLGNYDLEMISFRFAVKKQDIINNKIDPMTIKLENYHNEKWTSLDTIFISGEDNINYYYFYATTEHLSTFAVVGEELIDTPPIKKDQNLPINAIIAFICMSSIVLLVVFYKSRNIYKNKY